MMEKGEERERETGERERERVNGPRDGSMQ